MRVAFVGLGVMGFPMAGHLAKSGHEVVVYNRTTSTADRWCAKWAGKSAPTPAGLDPELLIGAISNGAAQSWQMENRWQTMVNDEFEFGFAVDLMRKDLAITLAEAKRNGATLEMTELVDRFYAEVQALGGSRWDTSSLIARLS